MKSSRLGRYILLAVALMIAVGGWLALKATEKQLRRVAADRNPSSSVVLQPPTLSAPRATGPMASGPSGPAAPVPEGEATSVPSTESDARQGIPPGAIW